jgi:hypothetical protein
MKKYLLLVLVSLFALPVSLSAQEFVGSTRTLEAAQRQHADKLKQKGILELIGTCQAAGTREGRQGVKADAAQRYADACASQTAAWVKADKKAAYNDAELREFDLLQNVYRAYLKEIIQDEMVLSYMVRERLKEGSEYRGYFTLDEEAASRLRLQALEKMPQETTAAKKWVLKASSFVNQKVVVSGQ